MVVLHVKKGNESQFLYETTTKVPIGELVSKLVSLYNGRLKISRICSGNATCMQIVNGVGGTLTDLFRTAIMTIVCPIRITSTACTKSPFLLKHLARVFRLTISRKIFSRPVSKPNYAIDFLTL